MQEEMEMTEECDCVAAMDYSAHGAMRVDWTAAAAAARDIVTMQMEEVQVLHAWIVPAKAMHLHSPHCDEFVVT